ncbi:MAG: SBBP repeat-containing protein [Campylobacterota bacterium]|nr:SBBP repeat-containing protein [Campylobacterota bacterium]
MKQKHGEEIYLAYNWGEGTMADLLETFYQLKLSGQVEESIGFFALFTSLANDAMRAAYEAAYDVSIAEIEQSNVDKMWEEYYHYSFKQSHRVLLISHSQGNLFANRIYTKKLKGSQYSDYFANLQVATPASKIEAKHGEYVTIFGDFVINPIFGSLESNAKGVPGHGFVSAYLDQDDPRTKIMNKFKQLQGTLDETSTQWKAKFEQSCLGGKVVHLEHKFDREIASIDNVYYESLGKLHQVGGTFVNGECPCDAEDQNITAKEGFITVGLHWNYPSIDMDLEFEAGIKDIDDIDGVGLEHYYVEKEGDIGLGYFGIHITHETSSDASLECLSETPVTLLLNVKKFGGDELFALDVAAEEALDLGHVADLYISEVEEEQPQILMLGGGSDPVGGNSGGSYVFTPMSTTVVKSGASTVYELIPVLDQALLGPLGGAAIELYDAFDSNMTLPLHTGSTTYGGSNITTGLISFPSTFREELEDEKLYLLAIKGGEDIDADDDMKLDENVTVNKGALHAIYSGAQIKAQGLKVNILTEVGYQLTKGLLAQNATTEAVEMRLDEVAVKLLKSGSNSDGTVDRYDLPTWLPYFDKSKLYADYATEIEPIVQKIYMNEAIYEDAYRLVYGRIVVDTVVYDYGNQNDTLMIDFNANMDDVALDQIDLVVKDSNDEEVAGSVTFDGHHVTFKPESTLADAGDYTMTLTLKRVDDAGQVISSEMSLVFSTPDQTPPTFLSASSVSLFENSTHAYSATAEDNSGSVSYALIGGDDKELFVLSTDGELSFRSIADYEKPQDSNADNRYEIVLEARDPSGHSSTLEVTIEILNIVEQTKIEADSITIPEDTPVGTRVGAVNVVEEGDDPIVWYTLASGHFEVDQNGLIYLRNPLNAEQLNRYDLRPVVYDSTGKTISGTLVIQIEDVQEGRPELADFSGTISSGTSAGTLVGILVVNRAGGDIPMLSLEGEGAEDFVITSDGFIRVADGASIDHAQRSRYTLQAKAVNELGESNPVTVTFRVHEWTAQYGNVKKDIGVGVAAGGDGSVYVTGTTWDAIDGVSAIGFIDVFVTKFDRDGNRLWTRLYGTSSVDIPTDIAVDMEGNAYIAGYAAGSLHGQHYKGNFDAFIIKIDGLGTRKWTRMLGSSDVEQANTIELDSAGNVYIAGSTFGRLGAASYGSEDMFVAHYSSEGNQVWVKQFGSAGNEYAKELSVKEDGTLYLAGESNSDLAGTSVIGDTDIVLVKYNPLGEYAWTKRFGTNEYDKFSGMVIDSRGDLYLAGNTLGYFGEIFGRGDDQELYVIKVDGEGHTLWQNTYGSSQYDSLNQIGIDTNDRLYLVGKTEGSMGDVTRFQEKDDAFMMQLNSDGSVMDIQQFGTSGWDEANDVAIDGDNRVLITGAVEGAFNANPLLGYRDVYVTKLGE